MGVDYKYLPDEQGALVKIPWRQSWLWDFRFDVESSTNYRGPRLPEPFRGWFPAASSSLDVFSSKTYDFSAGLSNYQVPAETNPRTLRVSFYDDQEGTILHWLYNWHNYIYPPDSDQGGYVTRLYKAAISAELVQLSTANDGSGSLEFEVLVFPDGVLQTTQDSQTSVTLYDLNLIVVGIEKSGTPFSGSARSVTDLRAREESRASRLLRRGSVPSTGVSDVGRAIETIRGGSSVGSVLRNVGSQEANRLIRNIVSGRSPRGTLDGIIANTRNRASSIPSRVRSNVRNRISRELQNRFGF